ncbi:MAG: transcription elongation factor subunit Spt4 [Nanoarchaeota archaeon]
MPQKACRQCRAIYEGRECPSCGSKESIESFKGKISVINPEASELAGKLKLTKPGLYAMRTR